MKSKPLFHLACILATLAVLALFIMILWLAATLPGWVVFPPGRRRTCHGCRYVLARSVQRIMTPSDRR